MKFYVSFCVSTTTESMKTNDIPLKSPIKWKQIQKKICNFQKCPKNLTNFGKFQNFFCISCFNFIGLFNGISFVFILLVVFDVQRNLSLAKTGVVYLSFGDCISNIECAIFNIYSEPCSFNVGYIGWAMLNKDKGQF